jgi:hypothetical protein
MGGAQMQVYLLGLVLFLGNLVLKSLPRLVAPVYALDTFTHLYIVRAIKAGRRIPRHLDGFLVDEYHHAPFAYPFLMHLVLALFPIRFLERAERFIGPLLSSIDVVVVYAAALVLSGSWHTALYTAVLYSIVPIAFGDALFLTPRIMGVLFVNVALACIVLFDLYLQWGLLALSVTMGVGIFLLHKFTSQAYIVGALSLLAVARHRGEIGVALACVLFVLALLPNGIYLQRILVDHIAVLKWHYAHTRREHEGLLRVVAREFAQTPLLVPFVIFLATDPVSFAGGSPRLLMLAWALGLLIVAWATSYIKPLQFLGEGERYKIYCGFPMAYLTVSYAQQGGHLWPALLLALAGIASAASTGRAGWRVVRSVSHSIEDLKLLCARLRDLPKEKVWALGEGLGPQVLYWARKKVFGGLSMSAVLKEPDLFPRLKVPHAHVIEKFGIDYLLVDDLYADLGNFDLGPYRELAREGRYRLLEILREAHS